MKKFIFILTLVFISTEILAQEEIGMVTGSKIGTYYKIGEDMANIARKVGLNIIVKESQGSLNNITRLLSNEPVSFGIVQSDVLGYLARSKNSELHKASRNLRVIFPLYDEEVHLFAKKEIKTISDLEGKKVVIGKQGSGNIVTATNMMNIMGIKPGVALDDLSPEEAVQAVLEGKADAMFYVVGKPASVFKNIEKLVYGSEEYAGLIKIVHFVPIKENKILKEYTAGQIRGDDYRWLEQKIVPAVTVKSVLISFDFSSKNSEYYRKRCGQLAKLGQVVRDNLAELKQTGHDKWKEVNLDKDLKLWQLESCSRISSPQFSKEKNDNLECIIKTGDLCK